MNLIPMKSVSWSKLPNEILLNIFQRNDDNTNTQCSLTCRNWKFTAQCTLFEKIPTMDEKKLDLMSKSLSNYQNNCSDFGQSPGNYVKNVDCRASSDTYDWELLDRLFPFLEAITINHCWDTSYEKCYSLLKEGKFPNLKKLLTTGGFNNPPAELLLDRKEKIEELKLYSTSLKDKILQNLHLFTSLKRFDLHYYLEVEHLENLFPKEIINLESLSILFRERFANLDTTLININDIQPFPNTREMVITYTKSSFYKDKYFLYIMKKFPNLETLQLSSCEQPYCTRNDHTFLTIDCLFQFLVYLAKMKRSSYAGYMITSRFTTQLVKKFLNYIIDQRTVYYENMNINLEIMINVIEPGQEHNYHPDCTEYITIQNQKAGYDGYKENICILNVMYFVIQGTTLQPYLQLFREVGNMNITHLRIMDHMFTGINITYQDLSHSIIPVELDEIFNYFSKLKHLEINQTSNFIWNKEEGLVEDTMNSTIEYLKFSYCALSTDMFPMISKRCQNLNVLDLSNCWYVKNNGDQVISRYFPIYMPSTCLEKLMISLSYTEEYEYKKAFIRLITNNKKPRYCKITTETDSPIIDFPEQDCTKDHYDICLHDEECGVFDIYCESVVELTVFFDTGSGWDEQESWKEREYLEEGL